LTASRAYREGPEMETDRLLDDIVAVVARELDPEAIVLFGSRAIGDARADSDVDLLIVTREAFGPATDRRAVMVRLWTALAGIRVAKDLLVYSREEVAQWRQSRNHVIANALREGRLLYGSI